MAVKVRWVRQRDLYRCGPIAVLNILKWMGGPWTHKMLPAVQILCKCDADVGTSRQNIERAMKALGIIKKRRVFPKLKEIDKHLDNGGVILLEYFWDKFYGHYALCIGRTEKHYLIVNDSYEKTVTKWKRNELRIIIKRCRGDEKPWAWFIYKRSMLG